MMDIQNYMAKYVDKPFKETMVEMWSGCQSIARSKQILLL